MGRLATFVPRLIALTLIWLLATAALTYAAGRRMAAGVVKAPLQPVTPAQQKILVVPDVRKQAYVFAKGLLGDNGFAWRVQGKVQGFAANLVASQSPAPGTRVFDTGAPTVVLTLSRGGKELGASEAASSFPGTPVKLADVATNVIPRAALAKPNVKVAAKKAAPAKPAAVPARVHAVAVPAPQKAAAQSWPQHRPPAFVAPGAKQEPLDEMPLTDRAAALSTWLDSSPKPTDANVQHWLYQNQWIVTGARMGWWRGAEALKGLVAADRKAFALWGIGARSEAVARQALAEVEARS